jgi:hypothetical protein
MFNASSLRWPPMKAPSQPVYEEDLAVFVCGLEAPASLLQIRQGQFAVADRVPWTERRLDPAFDISLLFVKSFQYFALFSGLEIHAPCRGKAYRFASSPFRFSPRLPAASPRQDRSGLTAA